MVIASTATCLSNSITTRVGTEQEHLEKNLSTLSESSRAHARLRPGKVLRKRGTAPSIWPRAVPGRALLLYTP